MGDVGDYWKDVGPILKEESRNRKDSNKEYCTNKLNELNIPFKSHNAGIHLVVMGIFDYWPSTGKFINRKNRKSGHGINSLLKQIKLEKL